MKLDIECSEERILTDLGDSLGAVRNLIIEYHRPAKTLPINSYERIRALLVEYGFDVQTRPIPQAHPEEQFMIRASSERSAPQNPSFYDWIGRPTPSAARNCPG